MCMAACGPHSLRMGIPNGWPPLALRLVMRDEKFDQRLHIGGPDAEGLRAILLVDAQAYSFPNRFKMMVIPHQ